MTKAFLLLLLLISFNSVIAQNNDKYIDEGLIIYSAVLKKKNEKELLALGFKNKQPDSIFYSVLFNNKFSIKFFSSKQKLEPPENMPEGLEQYSLNFIDSNYSIKKNPLCNTKYKNYFFEKNTIPTNVYSTIQGIECIKHYEIDHFGDTTFYFMSNKVPKSAGIKIIANTENCILGIENKLYSIYPVAFDTTDILDVNKLMKVPDSFQEIRSESYNWIDGRFKDIIIDLPFPEFLATDISKQIITEQFFLSTNKNLSVVLFLDYIKFCKDFNSALVNYYAGAEEQSFELLDALDRIALENHTKYIVITNDYWENIKELNFSNLHIVPNASEWQEKVSIYEFPVIATVNQKGIVKDFISLFDLDNRLSYYEGLKKEIEKK